MVWLWFVQPDFESQCDWLTHNSGWAQELFVVLQAVPWWG